MKIIRVFFLLATCKKIPKVTNASIMMKCDVKENTYAGNSKKEGILNSQHVERKVLYDNYICFGQTQ